MSNHPQTDPCPLCVDLDGTLVKTDTFVQALLRLLRNRPVLLFLILCKHRGGLAAFKQRIAREAPQDPSSLPFHQELLTFLQKEHKKGRPLFLVTASDEQTARAVADHVGIFSGVIASDGTTNLKAARKRDALVERFGERRFDYAGNASDDLPVWNAAAGILAVNPGRNVRRALKNRPAQIMDDRPAAWKVWLDVLRIRQWLKNILIFLPMLLAHEVSDLSLYARAVPAFLIFGLSASAVYILNDLFDLNADQLHPRKKQRPFAAGNLHLTAAGAAPLLILSALALARLLPPEFTAVLLLYLLITTLYSWRLKQIALLDVLTLAGLYAMRILAGTAAYGIETSTWLIAFSIFVFFSLALVKRYAELREAVSIPSEIVHRRGRGYREKDLPLLVSFGTGSGCVSVLVLALYINSEKVIQFYSRPNVLWLLCPLFLYWIARIWMLAVRGDLSDDPVEFAARDPQTWVIGALSAAILVLGSL